MQAWKVWIWSLWELCFNWSLLEALWVLRGLRWNALGILGLRNVSVQICDIHTWTLGPDRSSLIFLQGPEHKPKMEHLGRLGNPNVGVLRSKWRIQEIAPSTFKSANTYHQWQVWLHPAAVRIDVACSILFWIRFRVRLLGSDIQQRHKGMRTSLYITVISQSQLSFLTCFVHVVEA